MASRVAFLPEPFLCFTSPRSKRNARSRRVSMASTIPSAANLYQSEQGPVVEPTVEEGRRRKKAKKEKERKERKNEKEEKGRKKKRMT